MTADQHIEQADMYLASSEERPNIPEAKIWREHAVAHALLAIAHTLPSAGRTPLRVRHDD